MQRGYSDNHKSIIKACEELVINHELSLPGIHQTNAIIENKNQLVFVQDLMLFLFAQTFARPRAQSQLRESGVVLETGLFEDDIGSGSGSVDPMRS